MIGKALVLCFLDHILHLQHVVFPQNRRIAEVRGSACSPWSEVKSRHPKMCVSRAILLKMDREIKLLRSNWWTVPMLYLAIYFVVFDRKARGQKLNAALSEIQHVALALRGSRRHRIHAFQRSSYSDRSCFANLVLRHCSFPAG